MPAFLTFPGEWLLMFGIVLVLGAWCAAIAFVIDRIASHFAT